MQYSNYLIQSLKDWWYPPEQPQKGPVEKLRNLLKKQQQNYKESRTKSQQITSSQKKSFSDAQVTQFYFNTKHTSPEILIERVCMMYACIIAQKNKQYATFMPIVMDISTFPIQLLSSTGMKTDNKNCIGLRGDVKLNEQKIKCTLSVSIIFHNDIENSLPWIYIINPDTVKMQISPSFRNIYYKQIIGGVLLVTNQSSKNNRIAQQWNKLNWQNYRQYNLLNCIQNVNKTLVSHFPFVKRYLSCQLQENFINNSYFKQMPQQLKSLLPKIQQLSILKASILSETNELKSINSQLAQILQKQVQTTNFIKVLEGEEVLEIMAETKAYEDCLNYLQKKFEAKQINFQEITIHYKQFCERIFEKKFMLDKIINK